MVAKETLKSARSRLAALLGEVEDIERQITDFVRPLEARREDIKEDMRQLRASFPSLFEAKTGKTSVAKAGGMAVNITQADSPIKVDYNRLLVLIGQAAFTRCVVIKTGTIDYDQWNEVLAEELAKESDLQECISYGTAPKAAVKFEAVA